MCGGNPAAKMIGTYTIYIFMVHGIIYTTPTSLFVYPLSIHTVYSHRQVLENTGDETVISIMGTIRHHLWHWLSICYSPSVNSSCN